MYLKYLKIMIVTFLVLPIIVIAINYIVDPLSYIRGNKASYFSSERRLKARLIEEGQYDGIVMGSSKATYIHPEDLNLPGTILNASFSAALPEEMLLFLKEKRPKVKWVAIGFDWFMFNENTFPYVTNTSEFSKTFKDILPYLSSKDTTLYSLRTIVKKLLDNPVIYTVYGAKVSKRQEKADMALKTYSYNSVLTGLSTTHFARYEISQRRINDVAKIQQWADENNVLLVGWMNPYQKEVISLLEKKLNDGLFLPSMLSKKIYKFNDLSRSYPSRELYWKEDPYHYYPSFGAQFFNKHIVPLL